MAEPKKKLSKTRTHRRRAQYQVTLLSYRHCSHCGEPILPHQACPHCGYYRDKLAKPALPKAKIVAEPGKSVQ